MEGVNDATLQPVGNKMPHYDAVMSHGLIKRRYVATNRQHKIHHDAVCEPKASVEGWTIPTIQLLL